MTPSTLLRVPGTAFVSLALVVLPVAPALTGCASQQDLAELQQVLDARVDRHAVLEEKQLAVGLTPAERDEFVKLSGEIAQLRTTRQLIDPATGPGVIGSWLLRLASGDLTAISEGAIGTAAAYAGWRGVKKAKVKVQERQQIPEGELGQGSSNTGKVSSGVGAPAVPPSGSTDLDELAASLAVPAPERVDA